MQLLVHILLIAAFFFQEGPIHRSYLPRPTPAPFSSTLLPFIPSLLASQLLTRTPKRSHTKFHNQHDTQKRALRPSLLSFNFYCLTSPPTKLFPWPENHHTLRRGVKRLLRGYFARAIRCPLPVRTSPLSLLARAAPDFQIAKAHRQTV